MARVNNRILKKYVILCEGVDAQNFIIAYLNSDSLAYDKKFSEDIQVFDFGGIADLAGYLKNFRNMENYDSVTSLLAIRDSETDVTSAIDKVRSDFGTNRLPVPEGCNVWKHDADSQLQTAFTLFPTCSNEPKIGALEDLCWKILSDKYQEHQKDDVLEFDDQMNDKYHSIGPHMHKSRLHTLFSVNEDFISLKIGEAAKAGAFDWGSMYLEQLKQVISQGFKCTYCE